MRSLLSFSFLMLTILSFADVCQASTESDETSQEVSDDTSIDSSEAVVDDADTLSLDLDDLESAIIAETILENEEETLTNAASGVVASKTNPPLAFPDIKKLGKSQRKLNKDMAVKMASILEQAVMMVANDILQTAVLVQIDPADFLQINETDTTTTTNTSE